MVISFERKMKQYDNSKLGKSLKSLALLKKQFCKIGKFTGCGSFSIMFILLTLTDLGWHLNANFIYTNFSLFPFPIFYLKQKTTRKSKCGSQSIF